MDDRIAAAMARIERENERAAKQAAAKAAAKKAAQASQGAGGAGDSGKGGNQDGFDKGGTTPTGLTKDRPSSLASLTGDSTLNPQATDALRRSRLNEGRAELAEARRSRESFRPAAIADV